MFETICSPVKNVQKMFEAICDPAKNVQKGEMSIFVTNTGMIIAGEYFGRISSTKAVVIKNPALIQNQPQVQNGKHVMNLCFTLLLPNTACTYKTRYAVFSSASIITIEKPLEDMQDAYKNFCTKVDDSIFALAMTPEEMEAQDKYYTDLCDEVTPT